MIVEDDESDINSEDEEFYGRKTVRGLGPEVIKHQSIAAANEELVSYKRVAVYSGVLNLLNQHNRSCMDFKQNPLSTPRDRLST